MTTPTPIDVLGVFNALTSHAARTGLFETTNGYEAINSPGNGVHYEVFLTSIGPVRGGSGLSLTSAVVIITGRISINLNRGTRESVETDLLYTTDRMISEYTGQFQLGLSNVRSIDLLGMHGTPLSAKAGYADIDTFLFRIADITIPIVINDAYGQAN